MSHTDDEIEYCRTRLRHALTLIDEYKAGVRWFRGTSNSPPQDVTDKHRELAENDVEYWRKRLELLGAADI